MSSTQCETDGQCGEGQVFSPSSSQCCGRCVASHCLLQDGTRLEAGQSVEAAGSPCKTSLSCSIVNGTAVIERSSQSCPALPPDCPPASVRPGDPRGCCQVCLQCRDRGNITRNIGDYWKADSCTTCTCLEDGAVSCTTRDCPPLAPDCPPQLVSTDSSGCCPRCNRPDKPGQAHIVKLQNEI